MKHNFELQCLASRHTANTLRFEVIKILTQIPQIIFNFKNVSVVTDSYAHELFGGLLWYYGSHDFFEKIKIENANPYIERTIATILNEEMKKQRGVKV